MARGALAGLALLAVLAPPSPARAEEIAFGPYDVPTVFFISKSDDKNRVDYGLRLDATCSPVNDDAVFLYWRVFEKAPPVRTKPLSLLDYIPYGVAEKRVVKRSPTGGEYAMRLKQFGRPIVIATKKEENGKCSAVARAPINGKDAQLLSVFAKLAGLASVEYIDVFGKDLESGASITERIKK
jgi:hypothetical protein